LKEELLQNKTGNTDVKHGICMKPKGFVSLEDDWKFVYWFFSYREKKKR